MPYKYKRRTPYKKKTYKSKKYNQRYNKNYTPAFTALSTGPKTLIRKLRYSDKVSINPSLGVGEQHLFRANGCYDPDITGTGHQPMAFDTYMAMYDHFQVIGSKITVQFIGSMNASSPNFISYIYLDDDASAITNVTRLIENGQTSYRVCNTGQGIKPTTLSKTFSSKKFFGRKLDDTIQGSSSGDPTEQAVFHVGVEPIRSGSSDVDQTDLLVTIDYIVKFTERTTLAQS